jgi:hypothetical protein
MQSPSENLLPGSFLLLKLLNFQPQNGLFLGQKSIGQNGPVFNLLLNIVPYTVFILLLHPTYCII